MNFLYKIYQLFIALPLAFVATVLTALVTIVGSLLGSAHFWGYYPGKIWSQFICNVLLLPVKVEGGKTSTTSRATYSWPTTKARWISS